MIEKDMINILITGSDGFIGNFLFNYFSSKGYSVYGTTFIRKPGKNEILLNVMEESDFTKLWDIEFDLIIHTVGIMNSFQQRKLLKPINVKGTKRIVNWAISHKPEHRYQYIHARYDVETMEEIWDEWGNKQNDAVGALLFKIGDLENKGKKIIRGDDDLRIIQKLVYYLGRLEYWHEPGIDQGV